MHTNSVPVDVEAVHTDFRGLNLVIPATIYTPIHWQKYLTVFTGSVLSVTAKDWLSL